MRLDSLAADVRFAFRTFRRAPAVALTVVGTLAVALGLNATAYSFFNAYVMKPANVWEPGTLYRATWENGRGVRHWFVERDPGFRARPCQRLSRHLRVEIGIRMALGESAAGIVGLILRQSMRLCATGLLIGLTLAVLLSTGLASTLVMLDTFDAAAFAAGTVIVVVACLAAAIFPARRAAGVEPLVALRIE